MEKQQATPGIREQLTFKGTAVNASAGQLCGEFISNRWKPMRCTSCGHDMREHVSNAVKDEDVLKGIAEEQSKDGANIILEAKDGWGSLHLGGFMASGIKYVDSHHITHVVNAAGGLESFFVGWAKQLPQVENKGVRFLRLGWADSDTQPLYRESPFDQLCEAVEFIHEARKGGGHVVVHCAQGKSRSSTVVVAYLLAAQPDPLDVKAALALVQSKRPSAEPNPNFMKQLQQFATSEGLAECRRRLHGTT